MKITRFGKINYEPASHEDPNNPGVLKKILCKRDELADGKVQMINWAFLPKGKAFKPHYHEDMEEVFIILSGKVEIIIKEDKSVLKKGDLVIIPTGKTHIMRNIGDSDAYYIAIGISSGKGGRTIIV